LAVAFTLPKKTLALVAIAFLDGGAAAGLAVGTVLADGSWAAAARGGALAPGGSTFT
jgi:hypothetical protein